MRIMYNNLIDALSSGSIIASTALTAYPVTNIQDQRLTKKWATSTSTSNSVIFTFDTFPEYPNSSSGTVYINPTDWSTGVDGWTSASDLAIVNNNLRLTCVSSAAASRALSETPNGKMFVVRAKCSKIGGVFSLLYYTGSMFPAIMSKTITDTNWFVISGYLASGATGNSIYTSLSNMTAGDTYDIKFVYAGNGAYSSLIKDESENAFNFSANSILLTTGANSHNLITFNGYTSYLKSASTLNYFPDVLTTYFSFPSGWAQTVTARSIYNYATAGSGFISEYKTSSSDSLIISYNNGATTATVILPSVFTGYSSSRLDLCVIKNFSSSVSYLDSINTISAYSVYVYINGNYFTSSALTSVVKPNSGDYFYIGALEGTGQFSNMTTGVIKAYSRGLGISEIKNIYNGISFNTENLGLIFNIDQDYEYSVNTAAILGHNIKSGTKVQLLADNANEWSAPLLNYTFNYVASSQTILAFLSSSYIYKYWKFQFSNQSDLNIGRIWLGKYETIDPSSSLDFTITKKRSDIVIYGKDRQKWSNPGVGWRRFELSFPKSDYTMVKKIEDLYDSVGLHSSFIFCNFDTIRDYQIVEPCYVSFSEDMQFQHVDRMKFTYSLIMEEDK